MRAATAAAIVFWALASSAAGDDLSAPSTARPPEPIRPEMITPERDIQRVRPRQSPPTAFDRQGRIAPLRRQLQNRSDNHVQQLRRNRQPGYVIGPGNVIQRRN
ncbi:MAG: hypothetical protein AAF367_13635 [Pseudomonadota bacterium]